MTIAEHGWRKIYQLEDYSNFKFMTMNLHWSLLLVGNQTVFYSLIQSFTVLDNYFIALAHFLVKTTPTIYSNISPKLLFLNSPLDN